MKIIGTSPTPEMYATGLEIDCQCARCGSGLERVDCWNCEDGFSDHDCGEDCCVCRHPEPNVPCDVCDGDGGWWSCLSSREWCKANPMPGREGHAAGEVEWFTTTRGQAMKILTPQERVKLRRKAITRIVTKLADLPQLKDRAVDNEQIELIVDMEMPQHLADAQAESDELDALLRSRGMLVPKKGPSLLDRLRTALGLEKSTDISLTQIMEAAIERIEAQP